MDEYTDWSHWPVLHVTTSNAPPAKAPHILITALQAALDRGEPFAAVLDMPTDRRERGGTGAAERVRMLKTIRPGLADRCRGLAFIMPAQAQHDNAKTINAASKVWQCPTTATDNLDAARAWADRQLTDSNQTDAE